MGELAFVALKSSSPTATSNSYYIAPPDGGESERYMRVSKFIKALQVPDDTSNLEKRTIRYSAIGAVKHFPELKTASAEEDKQEVNKILERAARKEGIWDSADYGTAVHAWTEDIDNGVTGTLNATGPDSPALGPAVQALKWGARDLFAGEFDSIKASVISYLDLVEAHGLTYTRAEATIVIDAYKVAGTLDRLGNVADWSPVYHCEKSHVLDVKTGSIDFGRREKTMQFAAYAKADLYNHDTHERTPHGACQDMAYILHLPAKQVNPSIIPIPLESGMADLELSHTVWQSRGHRHMWKKFGLGEWLTKKIEGTRSLTELEQLYDTTKQYWTPEHVDTAKSKGF